MSYNITQIAIFWSISFIIPYFTSKAYDVYHDRKYISFDNKNWKEKEKEEDIYKMNKFMYMLIISSIYIIGGYFTSIKTMNMSLGGISIGGLFLLAYNLIINWRLFDEKKQLLILGLILLILLYIGIQIKF